MTEPREHALEQSESAVGVVRSLGRTNELAHFYDRGEQTDAEAVGVSVSKPSAAKTCSHVFIAEPREHATNVAQ